MEGNVTVSTLACRSSCLLDKSTRIVRDDALFYFRTSISIVLMILTATSGITTNIVNIIVYYKQGFNDRVNITFMVLSMWDLSVCLLCDISSFCFIIDTHFPLPYFSTLPIRFVYVTYSKVCLYILLTIVTVYLSVERCVCIMFPLKVKDIFTTRHVILINLTIVVFGLACICPAWATQGTLWVFNPTDNITRLVLWLSANRRDIDLFVDTFNGMVLTIVAQVLITVSSGFMLHCINKSSKFRQKAAGLGRSGQTNNSKNESLPKTARSNFYKRRNMMTNKDVKLTKVVILLAIIFFSCNLPLIVTIFVRVIFAEVDVGRQEQNLYELLYAVVWECLLLKSTVNMFVYYYASSRYKRQFLTLFRRI